APEHPDVAALIADHQKRDEIEAWINTVRNRTALERQESGKEGRFTGKTATNPFTNKEIPIWLGNFVLMQYGTGAIMAVPAHDQRDFEFAMQHNLPIRAVVSGNRQPTTDNVLKEAYVDKENGFAINSGVIDGLPTPQAIE